jgi:hypothetical protein
MSDMSDSVGASILKGQPFGGVICTINNDLSKYTEIIPCLNRMSIIKVCNQLIINIYMPCIGTDDRFLMCNEIIADLRSWRQQFPMCECLTADDFNVNYLDSNDVVSQRINDFIHKNGLKRFDVLFQKDNIATYVNDALHHQFTIYYILTSSCDCVEDFDILVPDNNFSDHLPLVLTCVRPDSNNVDAPFVGNVSSAKLPTHYRWDRADLLSYYSYTGQSACIETDEKV